MRTQPFRFQELSSSFATHFWRVVDLLVTREPLTGSALTPPLAPIVDRLMSLEAGLVFGGPAHKQVCTCLHCRTT